MTGTLEIFVKHMTLGEESIGTRFDAASPENLASQLQDMGFTALAVVSVPVQPGNQPARMWTGVSPDGRAARIVAWVDVPFDETAIGKALAAGQIARE